MPSSSLHGQTQAHGPPHRGKKKQAYIFEKILYAKGHGSLPNLSVVSTVIIQGVILENLLSGTCDPAGLSYRHVTGEKGLGLKLMVIQSGITKTGPWAPGAWWRSQHILRNTPELVTRPRYRKDANSDKI